MKGYSRMKKDELITALRRPALLKRQRLLLEALRGGAKYSPLAKAVLTRTAEKANLIAMDAYKTHLQNEMARLDAIHQAEPTNARVLAKLDKLEAEYRELKDIFMDRRAEYDALKASIGEMRKGYGMAARLRAA
jgi:chromosome segregation ATPase